MYDVIIEGATLISGSGRKRADLAITGERISAVLTPGEHRSARTVVDAHGLMILPGLIDTHVHLRDPARPDRETFESGTAAAASGGVTTICEMPTSDPPVNSADRLLKRAETVQSRALVDFALYGGAGPENIDEIPRMARAGAIAFKTWLHAPAKGREQEFIGLSCPRAEDLPMVMSAVASTGLRHALHCEDEEVLKDATREIRGMISSPGIIYALSRPVSAEDSAVLRALHIAKENGARVQIVHVSSPSAVRLVDEAKRLGVDATTETCPHYLALTEQALKTYGSFAKCNPPLRPESAVEELWHYLQEGRIDVIGSDHCAFLPSELAAGNEDIFCSPPGLPGLDTMLPVLLTAVDEGRLRLEDVARLTSHRAAQIFGLRTKGVLRREFDADFVIVDPDEKWVYNPARSFSKAGVNAVYFKNHLFTGRVKQTWARGRQVFDGERITGTLGAGHFISGKRLQPSH